MPRRQRDRRRSGPATSRITYEPAPSQRSRSLPTVRRASPGRQGGREKEEPKKKGFGLGALKPAVAPEKQSTQVSARGGLEESRADRAAKGRHQPGHRQDNRVRRRTDRVQEGDRRRPSGLRPALRRAAAVAEASAKAEGPDATPASEGDPVQQDRPFFVRSCGAAWSTLPQSVRSHLPKIRTRIERRRIERRSRVSRRSDQLRHRGQQRSRVRMARRREDGGGLAHLDDASAIHDNYPPADVLHRAEVIAR